MAKGNIAFITYVLMWRQKNGKAYGLLDPENPTPGATSHAYLMDDPITVNFPDISREKASFKGGGNYFGSMRGGITELGDITFESAHLDATARSIANNSLVDTTSVSGWTISGENENEFNLRQMGIAFMMRYQDRDTGSDGVNKWLTIVVPQCEIEIKRPASVGRTGGDNPAPARCTVTPSMGSNMPTGIAFGANQGFKSNRCMAYEIESLHPLGLTVFVADGVLTQYTLSHLPVYNTVTTGNTNQSFTKNSAAAAPSSVSTSTGVVAITAGSSADEHRAMFQTDFVAA